MRVLARTTIWFLSVVLFPGFLELIFSLVYCFACGYHGATGLFSIACYQILNFFFNSAHKLSLFCVLSQIALVPLRRATELFVFMTCLFFLGSTFVPLLWSWWWGQWPTSFRVTPLPLNRGIYTFGFLGSPSMQPCTTSDQGKGD